MDLSEGFWRKCNEYDVSYLIQWAARQAIQMRKDMLHSREMIGSSVGTGCYFYQSRTAETELGPSGLSREASEAADSAQLRLSNLNVVPNLEAGSCTDVFDVRKVALQRK
ncbi:hypothetical protein PIB30_063766 [Stylosanthes scabra]|uniref:Uncharacterized protein n=1 Tax=Stylosanthes scabra TaxID=79078 RepID=A0ABU6VJX0_9FABA|nr:hypothetical protein [Stylosanthes scabra]